MTDKVLAILGLVGVSIYAIYQGGAEAYSLVGNIVAAIAGFVTGAAVTGASASERKPKKDQMRELPDDSDN